jgi:hypothetical protein
MLASASSAPGQRGRPQANRITLTKSRRRNNSSGYNFARHLMLAGVAKQFAGSLESFAHGRDRLRFERSRCYGCTN